MGKLGDWNVDNEYQGSYSDEELYEIVCELDAMVSSMDSTTVDFIADVIDKDIRRFSDRQRQWIIDLKDRYLI